MSTASTNKLKVKDIITVVLLALINVVVFFASSLLYATPVTIILMPVFFALLEGVVYFIIGTKVKKPGAILIYSIVRAIMGACRCISCCSSSPVSSQSCSCGRWATATPRR